MSPDDTRELIHLFQALMIGGAVGIFTHLVIGDE